MSTHPWACGTLLFAILSCSALLSGCAGHATVHFVPLPGKRVTATGPMLVRLKPNECYYWVNEEDQLCLAMRERRRSLLGKAWGSDFVASFVLDGVPAGPARTYDVTRDTSRTITDAGLSHTRSVSLSGVAAVWDYGQRTIRGRFRILTNQQSYLVLTGWAYDQRVLFLGEFRAIPNEAAGRRLLDRTEQGALVRQPSP